MGKIIVTYGAIGGVIVAVITYTTMTMFPEGGGAWGMVVGYLTMLVALSMVFVGVKQYRDVELGGVIRFGRAFGVGLAIAAIATLFYVLTWELYMWRTDYRFMEVYTTNMIEGMRAAGKPAAAIAKTKAEMDAFTVDYRQPLYRMMLTASEIAPVALLVSLISAAVLRNPRRFPATA